MMKRMMMTVVRMFQWGFAKIMGMCLSAIMIERNQAGKANFPLKET